jgi:predicted DNA-binding WGR domain protein
MTLLHRRCDEKNMARFYVILLQESLFGDIMLIQRWGRIGTHGQTKTEWFDAETAALARETELAGQKRRRGYDDPTQPDPGDQ